MNKTTKQPQMNVSLTPELRKLVDTRVESGRYRSRSEVVRDALRLLEEREHLREWKREQLKDLITEGLESGDATPLDVGQIKREARAEWEAANESDND